MKKSHLILIAIAMSGIRLQAGDVAGNGGQVVMCGHPVGVEVSYQPEAGIYSLDFIQFRDVYDFEPVDSLEESFDRIETLLELLPAMQKSFQEYRRQIGNTKPSGGRRIWLYSDLRLVELNDQQTLRLLPPNCSHRDVGDEYGAFQIIVRRPVGDLIYYETYRPYMEKIQESPLQASFLFVHEWLWDYASDAYQSRQANAMLHQEGIDADEIATLFVGLKLSDSRSRVPVRKPSTASSKREVSAVIHSEKNRGVFQIQGVDFGFVRIPAGSFEMGSPKGEVGRTSLYEELHGVTISRDYWMQETEVTRAQYRAVMGKEPESLSSDCQPEVREDQHPVTCINRLAMQDFIDELNRQVNPDADCFNQRNRWVPDPQGAEARCFRLPTEAEWEYAARAQTKGPYSFTGRLDDYAWYKNNSGGKTHPVATRKKNGFGLYDMHGNVYEMVLDGFQEYPNLAHETDPIFPGTLPAIRGGGYSSVASDIRSSARNLFYFNAVATFVGFRLVSRDL